jgi:HSP20 family protein
MPEEQQQSRSAQPQGQQYQPQGRQSSGQATQGMQRRGNGQQTGMARRGGGMPSLFHMDPFDMLRMSPFAMMRRFMEDIEQQWGQAEIGRGSQGTAAAGSTFFSPPMEMFEREGRLIVRAELPGLSKDDVHVEVTDDALTIEGERRSEHEERQGGFFRSERRYGTFRRQIPLPEGVNADQVTASFKDGLLEIAMPAPQRQADSRRIEIQSGAASTSGAASGPSQQASNQTHQEHGRTTAERA